MEKGKMEQYKNKLLNEKKKIHKLIEQMKRNDTISGEVEMSSELSFYDNHPADNGGYIRDISIGRALKENEMTIISKIDDALQDIEQNTYGSCKRCHKEIPEDRLEFIPYAEYCVTCQEVINNTKPREKNNRAVEETVLGRPFGYGYNDFGEEIEFDAEDSYQAVERFDRRENVEEYYEGEEIGFVEPIEKISNEQYKAQLP